MKPDPKEYHTDAGRQYAILSELWDLLGVSDQPVRFKTSFSSWETLKIYLTSDMHFPANAFVNFSRLKFLVFLSDNVVFVSFDDDALRPLKYLVYLGFINVEPAGLAPPPPSNIDLFFNDGEIPPQPKAIPFSPTPYYSLTKLQCLWITSYYKSRRVFNLPNLARISLNLPDVYIGSYPSHDHWQNYPSDIVDDLCQKLGLYYGSINYFPDIEFFYCNPGTPEHDKIVSNPKTLIRHLPVCDECQVQYQIHEPESPNTPVELRFSLHKDIHIPNYVFSEFPTLAWLVFATSRNDPCLIFLEEFSFARLVGISKITFERTRPVPFTPSIFNGFPCLEKVIFIDSLLDSDDLSVFRNAHPTITFTDETLYEYNVDKHARIITKLKSKLNDLTHDQN